MDHRITLCVFVPVFQYVTSTGNSKTWNCSTASGKMTGPSPWTMRPRSSWGARGFMRSMSKRHAHAHTHLIYLLENVSTKSSGWVDVNVCALPFEEVEHPVHNNNRWLVDTVVCMTEATAYACLCFLSSIFFCRGGCCLFYRKWMMLLISPRISTPSPVQSSFSLLSASFSIL